MLNKYAELRASGLGVRETIERGSDERMLPILMTSLTSILGCIPLILAHDKPAGEFLAPLAIVQFGGLLCATLLNLLVLPAAYGLVFGKQTRLPPQKGCDCKLLNVYHASIKK